MKKNILICLNHSKKRISYWNLNFRKNKNYKVDTIYQRINTDRANFIEKIFEKIQYPIDITGFNKRIIKKFKSKKYHFLFVEKCLNIKSSTLKELRSYNKSCKFIFFSNDNMLKKHNQSKQFLDSLKYNLYHKIFLTNNNNYIGLEKITKSSVYYLDKSFCSYSHFRKIKSKQKYKYEVIFIGTYELERFNTLKYLSKKGIKIDVFGYGWSKIDSNSTNKNLVIHKKELFGNEYLKNLRSSKIALSFLRKINDDTQTSRSLEIPASGTFFLAENTYDHKRIYGYKNKDILFKKNSELLLKINKYINNPKKRMKILKRIQKKIVFDKQSFFDKIKILLN